MVYSGPPDLRKMTATALISPQGVYQVSSNPQPEQSTGTLAAATKWTDAPPKYDDLTFWHTINKKPDMLTIDDMQTYCKDVYLISLGNRWPMTFDDRSLQRHWNTRCCLSLIDYFLALFYKSNSLICRQGVSSVFYWFILPLVFNISVHLVIFFLYCIYI